MALYFVCAIHENCTTDMTFEEYENLDPNDPHCWINIPQMQAPASLLNQRAADRMARESDACWEHRVSQRDCPNCL